MCGEAQRRHPTNPVPDSRGHDVSLISDADARTFLDAYLNNRPDEVEQLRVRLAAESVPKTRAEANAALAAFIAGHVDEYGPTDEDFTLEFQVDNWEGENDVATLRGLVKAFEAANR